MAADPNPDTAPDATFGRELPRLGVAATSTQRAALVRFVDELLRWNARINLTAARTAAEVAHHVVDCASLVPHVPAAARTLVDVGSGGGLPVVVLAILRPDLEVTAHEPVHKKHAFLQHARRALGLARFTAHAGRIEDAPAQRFDVATSRATFALPRWLELGATLVHPGGVVLGMEGAEQAALPVGASRVSYELGDRTRAVVVYRPSAD